MATALATRTWSGVCANSPRTAPSITPTTTTLTTAPPRWHTRPATCQPTTAQETSQQAARSPRAATGAGVNDAIRDGYGFLTSRWRPGDKILLFGYSRGAYAVRSLAGLIDQVGLLRRRHAVHRRVSRACRPYPGS